MSCCAKRTRRKVGRGGLHKVRKTEPSEELKDMMNSVVLCGGCKQGFPINSDELKIHCNHCEQFFHCKVAGPCRGDDCQITGVYTGYTHRARYCHSCVTHIYNNGECLCIECGNKK